MSTEHYQYLGAIALNNMGITLLERGAYQPALEALKDSIVALRNVLRRRENQEQHAEHQQQQQQPAEPKRDQKSEPSQQEFPSSSLQSSDDSVLDIESMLQRATVALSETSNTSSSNSSAATGEVSRGNQLRIQVLSDSESLPRLESLIRRSACDVDSCFTLHMEWNDLETINDRDLDVDSAVVLYNLAMANQCLSFVTTTATASPLVKQQLRNAALMTLLPAQAILDRRPPPEDLAHRKRWLLVAASVLSGMARLFRWQGNEGQASATEMKVMCLVGALEALDWNVLLYGGVARRDLSAAAAA